MRSKTFLAAAIIPAVSAYAAFSLASTQGSSVAMGNPSLSGGSQRIYVDSNALPPANAHITGLSGGFTNATGLRIDGIGMAVEAQDPARGIPATSGKVALTLPNGADQSPVRQATKQTSRGYGAHIALKDSECGSLENAASLDFHLPVESVGGDIFTYFVPTIALPGESSPYADVLDGCDLSRVAPGAIKSMSRPFHRFAAIKVRHVGDDQDEIGRLSGSVSAQGGRLKSITLHHSELDWISLACEHSISGDSFSIFGMDVLEKDESCVVVFEFEAVPTAEYEVTIKATYGSPKGH